MGSSPQEYAMGCIRFSNLHNLQWSTFESLSNNIHLHKSVILDRDEETVEVGSQGVPTHIETLADGEIVSALAEAEG